MKKKTKKLVLAMETVKRLELGTLRKAAGGATALACNTIPCTNGCPSGPIECQSNRYPC